MAVTKIQARTPRAQTMRLTCAPLRRSVVQQRQNAATNNKTPGIMRVTIIAYESRKNSLAFQTLYKILWESLLVKCHSNRSMALDPRQHLSEGLRLLVLNLGVFVISVHRKAMWHALVDLDVVFNLVGLHGPSTRRQDLFLWE